MSETPDVESSGHDRDDARLRFNLSQVYSQEEVDALLKEQMEKYCRAMCYYCDRHGRPRKNSVTGEYEHKNFLATADICEASPIREKYEEEK